MARKKKRTARKSATRPKKKTKKRAAAPKSRSGATKSKSATRKKTPVKRSNTSVDSLLKRFDKDRSQKETQLLTHRKKREELESKALKLQEQIDQVTQKIKDTESEIAKLDSQRDKEVKELLATLGVKLGGGAASASSNKPVGQTPVSERGKLHRESLTHGNGRND